MRDKDTRRKEESMREGQRTGSQRYWVWVQEEWKGVEHQERQETFCVD